MAAYGPDDTRATKLVVSIVDRPDGEPSTIRSWITVAVDVRTDPTIGADVIAMDVVLADPAGASDEEAGLFSYALYSFAKWRETRAYPAVVRWLSLPGEQSFEIGGDIVTEDGVRILAAVCDGDLEPIKTLILDRRANRLHEVDNVFVVDGSSFTNASEKNPTLTILALAWRATDYLAEEMRKGNL